ncbi:MAG: carboxyl-terminal processing protease [Granulosicoccus sp.]|jgi:carboxyl-terminal processing protease
MSFTFKPFLAVISTLLLVVPGVNAVVDNVVTLTGTESQQKATLEILETLDKRHFVQIEVNDELSAKFLNNYIDQLDPSKSFFLQSDIDEFHKRQFDLDDELKSGDNSTGFAIYQRLMERMNGRLEQVVENLQSDFYSMDFSVNENFSVDVEQQVWSKTQPASDEQWRKRIKSYFLTQKLAGEPATESLDKLVKRYSDQLVRMKKNTDEDIYGIYINAFTELYDPHTNYFSPRASESFSIRMSLSLEGIGAVLQTEDGYTKVVRIVSAGPAHKQGQLKASDRIVSVGQGKEGEMVNVVGWRLDEVVELIRGKKDTFVRLEVSSVTADQASNVIEIKRDKVNLEDQAAQKAIITLKNEERTFKVGVINIPTFYLDFEAYRKRDPNFRSTTKDVNRLLTELEAEGVDGVIVDLRNNGGGSLYEATAVTDLFVDKGPVVQIGKDSGQKTSDYSQNNARYRGPLVVLINRLSASASEIFAGAIQDYHRGIVVGSQSFGKGTVQTLSPLKSQGELKITESKFYRISGESTQHRGVVPDISMPELINPEEVGESSYDTALAWSKTEPVRHGIYFSLESIIPSLTSSHMNRIEKNPDFIYLQERKILLDEITRREVISLNEKTRITEKENIEQRSLTIENNRRKAKGLTPFNDYNAFKEDEEEKGDERVAKAGTTQIDTEDDAILREAGYVLQDFSDMLQTQKKQSKNKEVAINP